MPLSEHEQHLLEQMEQALYAEDPKFASQMQGSAARARMRRRIIGGVLGVLVGLGLVVLGVMAQKTWLGAVGFAVMVGAAAYALTPAKRVRPGLGSVGADGTVRPAGPHKQGPHKRPFGRGERVQPAPARRPGTGRSFLQRLEQRWDRRREGGQ